MGRDEEDHDMTAALGHVVVTADAGRVTDGKPADPEVPERHGPHIRREVQPGGLAAYEAAEPVRRARSVPRWPVFSHIVEWRRPRAVGALTALVQPLGHKLHRARRVFLEHRVLSFAAVGAPTGNRQPLQLAQVSACRQAGRLTGRRTRPQDAHGIRRFSECRRPALSVGGAVLATAAAGWGGPWRALLAYGLLRLVPANVQGRSCRIQRRVLPG